MIYIKRIISKKDYGNGYHSLCHNEGISLLNYAISCEYPDFVFCEEDIKKGYRGKPYIENTSFRFNISHCDGLVACVLSKTEVGIDAEHIRQVTDRVVKRCYSDCEIEYINDCEEKDIPFTRLWTLKESYVKLTGEGIATDLKAVCFDLEKGTTFSDGLTFLQLFLDDGYIISVCTNDASGRVFCKSVDIQSSDVVILDI